MYDHYSTIVTLACSAGAHPDGLAALPPPGHGLRLAGGAGPRPPRPGAAAGAGRHRGGPQDRRCPHRGRVR